MIRLPPSSTRTDTLFPSTTLFRSGRTAVILSRMIRTVWLAGLVLATLSVAAVGAQPEAARFGEEIHVFSIEDEVRPATACATLFVGSSSIRFRSEERLVGKESVSTCRSRWSTHN